MELIHEHGNIYTLVLPNGRKLTLTFRVGNHIIPDNDTLAINVGLNELFIQPTAANEFRLLIVG